MLKTKYKTIMIFSLILTIISIEKISAARNSLPLLGTIITIDPGHGGRDSGTMYYKILEKDLNLEISKYLDEELTKKGAITYMIRESDIDLSSKYDPKKKRGDLYRRLLFMRRKHSKMYLSIHINWYKNENYQGAEVLYNPINKENKVLATYIMNEFKNELGSKRNIKTTDLYMYKNTTIPGVLIECGYLSNYLDRKRLQDPKYQQKISRVITNAVIKYLKTKNRINLIF